MSTMLESYDSQMFDPDIDIQMDPSTADSWFQQEDIVLDDPASPEKYSLDLPGGVEIDMDENIEYEMTDDPQMHSHADSTDLLDVEVPDASLAATPVIRDSETLPLSSPLYVPTEFSGTAHDGLHSMEYNQHHPDSEGHEPSQPDIVSIPLPAEETLGSHEVLSPVDEEVPVVDLGENSSYPELKDLTHETVPVSLKESDQPQNASEEFAPGRDNPGESGSDNPGHDSEDVRQVDGDPSEPPAAGPVEQPPLQEDQVDPDSYENAHPDHQSSGDPHEISDGVYIEPPPAVSLSIPGSLDIFLFNSPQPPRSSTPHSEEMPADNLATVLFQHLPTLYYEPLSQVFNALRQDEYLSRVVNLPSPELVLDAHDLELVVSEDNLYARDVSLHDLNVLHDGCAFTGPLRLRLQTVTPRFIVRYHQLQEQVNRNLHSATHEDESEHQTTELPQEEPSSLTHQEDDDEASAPPHEDEANEEVPQHDTADAEPTGQEEDAPEEQDQEVTIPNSSDEHNENPQDVKENAEAEQDNSHVALSGPDDHESTHEHGGDAQNLEDIQNTEDLEEDLYEVDGDTAPPAINEEGSYEDEAQELDEQTEVPVLTDDSAVPVESVVEPESENTEKTDASYDNWDEQLAPEELDDHFWEDADHETESNQSSVTLASKVSKRSFDDLETEEQEQEGDVSPGSKRVRVE